ncbi:MAG: GntR family transcriptional regulator [Chloroflexota bacterium]|nr:GntR family transcriptional regulator [Chloroflexota bacterium]
MELIRVDTKRAYEIIREKITTLELKPGAPIDESKLTKELDMGLTPIREALKLLVHKHLVEAPLRGLYVTDVKVAELQKISDIRLLLEPYCARQAAKHATADDLVVLNALCQEQAKVPKNEPRKLFDVDHKFHQAIANAADNKYLAEILEQYYGLSQRLWYLALPHLEFLPKAVKTHLEMVESIKKHDADRAEEIMRNHIQNFYNKVFQILKEL